MATSSLGVQQNLPRSNEQTLVDRVAFIGARPFASQVVQSPWNSVVDASSLHKEIKDRIRLMVADCGQTDSTRCLTVAAPPGYGKTHLLAWTRQMLDFRNDAVFVYVSPYTPGSPGGITIEQHVMRATVDALWSRSRRQQVAFEDAVRKCLVSCYDRVVDTGLRIKESLRAGTFWSRLFRRSRLKIGARGIQDQLAAIQRAFERRAFLEEAFAEFNRLNPVGADGVRPDWDTFVAACLLTCGDTRQRWHADRWLRGQSIPPDVLRPFHLDNPCLGTQKIRDGLFTLQRIIGESFCLTFDQLEDTYLALSEPGEEATRFGQMLGILLRNLSVMPGFCMIFAVQLSVWQRLRELLSPSLLDRMIEGHGAQILLALDQVSAKEILQERMQAAVWSQLTVGPPADQPCFPFTDAEVQQMRIDSGGELRSFLQMAQAAFETRLATPVKPPDRPPIILTSVEPREVMSHESTAILIKGSNLPADVRMLFNGQEVGTTPVCRPNAGEIDMTTPVGLVGDVEVRVHAADDPNNAATLNLYFLEREVPRPYRVHIEGELLAHRRRELNLSQAEVARRLVASHPEISQISRIRNWQPYIGLIEREGANVPDDVYLWLAELYSMPLSSFAKGPR